jgi:integrase
VTRRRSASLQARHQSRCKIDGWTKFDDAKRGCTCLPGPLYHVVTRAIVDGREKQVREPVGRNREQARRELLKRLEQIDAGSYQPPTDMGFSDWADEWLRTEENLKQSTRLKYESSMRFAKTYFGSRPVRQITTGDILGFRDSLTTSNTTKHRHLRVLGTCLEAAVGHVPPLATSNPVRNLTKRQRVRVDSLKAAPFDPDELERLWKVMPEPFLTMAKVAAGTGIRQGELIALRWGSFDEAGGKLSIREDYYQGVGFQTPKTKESSREVLLTPKVVELLKEWRGGVLPMPGMLVFPGAGRDGQMVDSTLRRALYDAMEDAKVSRQWKKPNHKARDWHSFRATYASLMLGKGATLEWLKEQLGHSSVITTEKAYADFSTDSRAEQAEKFKLDDAIVV